MYAQRLSFNAKDLTERYPPKLKHKNKRRLFEHIAPAKHSGTLELSRWTVMTLPNTYDPSIALEVESAPDTFQYDHPSSSSQARVDLYLNFSHHDMFCAYGIAPFAQDEIQVAEHPALASLREALLDSGVQPLTVEGGLPTPILIAGVERHAAIDTSKIYGARFTSASAEDIEATVKKLSPPTITNILAIEAPFGSRGAYTSLQLDYILETAYTGFRAAKLDAERIAPGAQVVIHTGFWGCGAYGGDRVLMPLLQLAAARFAQIDRFVFHSFDQAGLEKFIKAKALLESIADSPIKLTRLRNKLLERGFEWGRPDGN